MYQGEFNKYIFDWQRSICQHFCFHDNTFVTADRVENKSGQACKKNDGFSQ